MWLHASRKRDASSYSHIPAADRDADATTADRNTNFSTHYSDSDSTDTHFCSGRRNPDGNARQLFYPGNRVSDANSGQALRDRNSDAHAESKGHANLDSA